MRTICLVTLVLVVVAGPVARSDEERAPPQPQRVVPEPDFKPDPGEPRTQKPMVITAEVFWLEGAKNIALDTKEPRIPNTGPVFTSDEEFEAFLHKLHQAGTIRASNSASFLVSDDAIATPIECRASTMMIITPQGPLSFETAFAASILPPGEAVRVKIRARETCPGKTKTPHHREVDTGFDVDPGKTLVQRFNLQQVGRTESEWLLRITHGTLLPTAILSRVGPNSRVARKQ